MSDSDASTQGQAPAGAAETPARASEPAPAEKAQAERPAGDRPPAERAMGERAPADRPMGDRPPRERRGGGEGEGDGRREEGDDRGGPSRGFRGRPKPFFRRKVCKVCTGKLKIDYKDAATLRRFTTDRGKILPRRITGTCSKHQRRLAQAIKRARILALVPYVAK